MTDHNQSQFQLNVPDGTLLCTFLGQAGFLFQDDHSQIAIDPYLSNYVVEGGIGDAALFSRAFPAPIQPEEISPLDAVLVTHDHADHCDPLTIGPLFQANPGLKVVGPPSIRNNLKDLHIPDDQLIIATLDEWVQMGGVRIAAIPAAHYELEIDPLTNTSACVGYLVEMNGVTVFHAGDTIRYDRMVDRLQVLAAQVDIACLPVNGRDATRESLGMIGNLDGVEALQLAVDLHAGVFLPMHNDLFAANHETPAKLAEAADRTAARLRIHWLQPGEKYFYLG